MSDQDINTAETPTEILNDLAKPEDITEFAEQRQDDDRADRPAEDEADSLARDIHAKHPEIKRVSRWERKKRAMEKLRAENEELRSKLSLDPEPPAENQNPYEEEIDQGRWERSPNSNAS